MVALRISLVSLLLAIANAQNTFRLANIFQNDMVLQMEPKSSVIWGYGEANAEIVVSYESNQLTGVVGSDGIWRVELLPHAAGGPIDIQITHNAVDTVNLSALFGDVWVCSGQSNMQMTVEQCNDAATEINKAFSYTNIRLLQVQRAFNVDTELSEVGSFVHNWSPPHANNVPYFSALCLFFGERMSDSFSNSRPIGLIDSTWGGTRIEAWVSSRVPETCLTPANDGSDQNSESALWNAMMAPLTTTAVRGAIWYQGESNVGWNPTFYSCHMSAMIQDWADTFHSGRVPAENGVAFPFGIVQIGPTEQGENYAWGSLRFHQTGDHGVLPNSQMPEAFFSTAYDLTDRGAPTGDIHPRDKQTVADRMANAAKSLLYNESFSRNGPTPVSISVDANVATITYDRNIRIGGSIGFAIQKSDGTWSQTSISSSTSTTVSVNVDADTTILTLGYRATVCEYKECPVYSDDPESLPAQVWEWNIAALRKQ